jgi:HD-GYP domain-containing protein (c-di-GMP phosphodiesterase class II)
MSGVNHAWHDAPAELQQLLTDAEGSESRGRWRVAREQYDQAVREWPRPARSGVPIARAFRRIARCHLEEGDSQGALDALRVARVVATQYDDSAGIAHAINLEGIIAKQTGDLGEAERLFRAARSLAWHARERVLVAMIDQNLGTVANIRGDSGEAKLRYEASLAAYQVLNMPHPVGPLHNNLGLLHAELGQWREAEDHYRQALQHAKSIGDLTGRLRAEANRSELFVRRGKFRKAEKLARRVLSLIARDQCEGSWQAEALKHLGVIARERGDAQAATRLFARALEISERHEDALLTAQILSEQAPLLAALQQQREMLGALTRAHALFRKLMARPHLADVDRQLRALEKQFLEIVQEWGESIESADSYTQGHCQRVADLACLLAEDMQIEPTSLLWFRMGALLHDVGKIAVPAEILTKDGALTPDEMKQMRLHPVAGELMVGTDFPWNIRPMIRHHHERWDGTGYPDALIGRDIPLTARMLCVADVYDALTSTRSYRAAYPPSVALAIMQAESGRAFDPDVLRVFINRTLPRLRARSTMGAGAMAAYSVGGVAQ